MKRGLGEGNGGGEVGVGGGGSNGGGPQLLPNLLVPWEQYKSRAVREKIFFVHKLLVFYNI